MGIGGEFKWEKYHDHCSGNGAIDAYGGARYVFRYNTVRNTGSGHHGNDGGNPRSTMHFEYYHNTYYAEPQIWAGIFMRGGSGVIFHNEFHGNYTDAMLVTNYRTCFGEGWDGTGMPEPTRCDGSGNLAVDSGQHSGDSGSLTATISGKNWTNDEWIDYYLWNITDGSKGLVISNTAETITVQALIDGTDNDFDDGDDIMITNGYPCQDQIGRSTNQTLLPLFEWNNTKKGYLVYLMKVIRFLILFLSLFFFWLYLRLLKTVKMSIMLKATI